MSHDTLRNSLSLVNTAAASSAAEPPAEDQSRESPRFTHPAQKDEEQEINPQTIPDWAMDAMDSMDAPEKEEYGRESRTIEDNTAATTTTTVTEPKDSPAAAARDVAAILRPVLRVVTGSEEEFEDDEDAGICPLCYGSGMEVVKGKGARQCQCRKINKKTDPLAKTQIPPRYINCNFSSYIVSNESQRMAMTLASKLALEYPGTDRGLLLMGTVGVGKTHLAVSLLKGLCDRGFSGLFYEFGSLLKEIQSSYNSLSEVSELSVLSPIFKSEILVLDEIGASKPTEWVRDTMAHIITTRYNYKKLTIFTTNYLDTRRNEREETLEDRIGARLRSRLFEMCRTVPMAGDDFRRKYDRVSNLTNVSRTN